MEDKVIETTDQPKRCPFISSLMTTADGEIQPFIGFCIKENCEIYNSDAEKCSLSAACDSVMYFLTYMGGFRNVAELYQDEEETESEEGSEESEESEEDNEEVEEVEENIDTESDKTEKNEIQENEIQEK